MRTEERGITIFYETHTMHIMLKVFTSILPLSRGWGRLLNTYYVPGTALSIGGRVPNKQNPVSVPLGPTFQWGSKRNQSPQGCKFTQREVGEAGDLGLGLGKDSACKPAGSETLPKQVCWRRRGILQVE